MTDSLNGNLHQRHAHKRFRPLNNSDHNERTLAALLCFWIKVKHKQGKADGLKFKMKAVGVWMVFLQVIAPFAAPLSPHHLNVTSLRCCHSHMALQRKHICVHMQVLWVNYLANALDEAWWAEDRSPDPVWAQLCSWAVIKSADLGWA